MVVVWGFPGDLRSPFAIGNRDFFVGGGVRFKISAANFWRFHRAPLCRPSPVLLLRPVAPSHVARPVAPLLCIQLARARSFNLENARY